MANVNEHTVNYFALEVPMGGWKSSGIGSRHGRDGIRKYTRTQVSVITRRGRRRELFMYPYTRLTPRLLRAVLRLQHGRGRR